MLYTVVGGAPRKESKRVQWYTLNPDLDRQPPTFIAKRASAKQQTDRVLSGLA